MDMLIKQHQKRGKRQKQKQGCMEGSFLQCGVYFIFWEKVNGEKRNVLVTVKRQVLEYITCSKLSNILQRQTGRAAQPCALRPKGNEPHLQGESTYRTLRGNWFVFELMVGYLFVLFALFLIFVLLWFPGVTKTVTLTEDNSVNPSLRERGWARPGQSSIPWLLFKAGAFPVSELICRPMRECMYLSTALARPALHSLFFYPDHTERGG